MNSQALVESFSEFKDLKSIDRPTMMKVLEDVFRTLLRRKYGTDENFDIIVNTEKGDLEIWRRRNIVDDGAVEDPNQQIELTEAQKIEPDYQVGEEAMEEVNILKEFGRRAILTAKQTLASRVQELEKEEIFKKYQDRAGEIVNGEVYQVWKKETLLLDDEGNELVLPKNEQIPADFFKKGDHVRAVLKSVEMRNNSPLILLSRTDPAFLAKLLEQEVPEIFDGLITIKRIAREPGERAKVAVESYDDRIDPVGACVGMKGSRIHSIVRELRNENIDVINYTNNIQLFITRALTPSKISYMELDEQNKRAYVYLKPDQVSLAIGKGGANIKLASKLTGYTIDVFRDVENEEYDVDLDEFSDEIDGWIIDLLKSIGCDTAKSVLNLSKDELIRRTDLEEETVDEVLKILKSEFEEEKK
jgi:N utilization substance protein A